MKKWEYKVLRTVGPNEADTISVSINSLGQEGWELMSVLMLGGERQQFTFKREVSGGDSQENQAG